MEDLLFAWTMAVESEFAKPPEWVAWADRQILQLDEPPLWILDLSLVHSKVDALSVLWPACARSKLNWEILDASGAYLGFLYLRFQRGELSMLQLLLQAGNRADGAGFRIGCEAFYLLANEIDLGGPTLPSNRPLASRVVDLFSPMVQVATELWSRISV